MTVHLVDDNDGGPNDPLAPPRAACHTTRAVLEPTTRALTCQTCQKLAAESPPSQDSMPRWRRRSVSISLSAAEYAWLDACWPAGQDRAECIRRAVFNALEDRRPAAPRPSTPADIPVLHWPYIKACARELRRKDVHVERVAVDPERRLRSGVILLAPEALLDGLPLDEVSLAWSECDGWSLLASAHDGEKRHLFFGGEVVPEPDAATR